jgi:hypothetical protein
LTWGDGADGAFENLRANDDDDNDDGSLLLDDPDANMGLTAPAPVFDSRLPLVVVVVGLFSFGSNQFVMLSEKEGLLPLTAGTADPVPTVPLSCGVGA